MSRKKQWFRGGYIVVYVGLLVAGGIYIGVHPQKSYSANENRYLTKLPEITWEGIKKGEVQDTLETAFCDQFPARDTWLGITTRIQRAMGNDCIRKVYLGKDDYYFEQVLDSDLPEKQYNTNLQVIEALRDEGITTTCMLIPSPATIMKDKLPAHAVTYDSAKMCKEGAKLLQEDWLDISEALLKAKEKAQVYFRTDHHWTLAGAYEGYAAYCRHMGCEPKEYAYFAPEKASDTFLGTIYSKLLPVSPKKDDLYLAGNVPENIEVVCDGKTHDSVYDREKLNTKDKYAVFFGGNYGMVEITNPQVEKEKNLIVCKDSFANSMIPFLMEDYHKIIMIDLRYYTGSIKQLLDSYDQKEFLVLYEMSNFAKDDHLYRLIAD